MDNPTRPDARVPDLLYADPEPSNGSTREGGSRTNYEKREQTRALRALAGFQLVYAVRFPDGVIKIGCSSNLAQRLRSFRAKGGVVLGFMPGDFADEQAIHATLADHRARGREYYRTTPAVLSVVNEMRDRFNLPHVA